jgi:hypothetical protein
VASGIEEHLEPAEHARSAFDQRVAVTMAIVAALLASVTLLGHRAHNASLLLSADAARLQAEADIYHTRATDQWAFYQAKNTRSYLNQGLLALLNATMRAPGDDAARVAKEAADGWSAQIAKYGIRDRAA